MASSFVRAALNGVSPEGPPWRRVLYRFAVLASFAWVTFDGGATLTMRLIMSVLERAEDPYDIVLLRNIEVSAFGPPAVLWLVVFGIEWVAERRARSRRPARNTKIRSFLRPRLWIWIAFCLVWPAWIPIPLAVRQLQLPKIIEHGRWDVDLQIAFLAAVFVVPLILTWFALAAIERALARRKARPVS